MDPKLTAALRAQVVVELHLLLKHGLLTAAECERVERFVERYEAEVFALYRKFTPMHISDLLLEDRKLETLGPIFAAKRAAKEKQ